MAADVNTAPAAAAPAVAGFPQVDVPGNGRDMNKLEKAISDAMTSSLSMPTFHVTTHIKLGALIKASKAQGSSVTVTIAKACALAMQQWGIRPLPDEEKLDLSHTGTSTVTTVTIM